MRLIAALLAVSLHAVPAPTVLIQNLSTTASTIDFVEDGIARKVGWVSPGRQICVRLKRNFRGYLVARTASKRLLTYSWRFEGEGGWRWTFTERDLHVRPPGGALMPHPLCSFYRA